MIFYGQDATSLNSSGCFFLQVGEAFYTWYGKFSTPEEQEATKNMVYHLKVRLHF